jgi:hypothetical protein
MTLTAADRQTIHSVIERQLLAFQQDDAERAFSCASPGIREKFGPAANFLRMVQVAYPAVYRPRSVLFETLVCIQCLPAQEVLFLSSEGTLMKALYLMQKQPDGSWKIDGCFLKASQDDDLAE